MLLGASTNMDIPAIDGDWSTSHPPYVTNKK